MKKLIILLVTFAVFSVEAQSIKTLTDKAESATNTVDQSSFIDKFAGDQVKKLTKKLNLSDKQQSQISNLVVSQLKSDKFKKLIGSFSPEQLHSGSGKKEVSNALNHDADFKSGMGKILTNDQKKMAQKDAMKMKG